MPEYTPNAVAALANERLSTSENDARQSSLVRAAQAALDDAERVRSEYPYDDNAVQGVIDAQTALNRATNEFWREKRLRQLEADRAEKTRLLEEQQAARAAEIEATMKAEALAAWPGTHEQFEVEWTREGGLRARAFTEIMLEQQQAMKKSLQRATNNPGF